jgi:hypothetical protein
MVNHIDSNFSDPWSVQQPTTASRETTFYLKHFGQTSEEQLKKNKPLMEWLKKQIEDSENLTQEEVKNNQELLKNLKRNIDSFRPEEHKLFPG